MTDNNILLKVNNLSVSFGKGKKKFYAVDDVSFYVEKGETFGIVGESGSGKTTLARTIMRLYTPQSGEINFKGEKISGSISPDLDTELTKSIQMIFQDPMSSLNERAKVDYIISEGLYNIKNLSEEERERRISKVMSEVGLHREFGGRFPHEFSGGQRQRIGIARVLITEPELIIADEPISALDVSIRAQVLNLMSRLKKERGLTYIFISHDLSVMKFICSRIAAMYKGRIVEMADTEALFSRPLHPYTRSLLSAVPIADPKKEKARTAVSYDPGMHDYSEDLPVWNEIENGHYVYSNKAETEQYREMLSDLHKLKV